MAASQNTIEADFVVIGAGSAGCAVGARLSEAPATRVVPLRGLDGLPLGVQIVAAPWHEVDALCVAAAVERAGVTNSEPAYA